MSERVRCPACGALVGFRSLPPKGLWERGLARLVGMKPYRCEACRNRILRRAPLPDVTEEDLRASETRAHAPFAPEFDTDKFGELIEEIAAAERRKASDKLPRP